MDLPGFRCLNEVDGGGLDFRNGPFYAVSWVGRVRTTGCPTISYGR